MNVSKNEMECDFKIGEYWEGRFSGHLHWDSSIIFRVTEITDTVVRGPIINSNFPNNKYHKGNIYERPKKIIAKNDWRLVTKPKCKICK